MNYPPWYPQPRTDDAPVMILFAPTAVFLAAVALPLLAVGAVLALSFVAARFVWRKLPWT